MENVCLFRNVVKFRGYRGNTGKSDGDWVKVLFPETGSLSSIPQTHMWKKRTDPCKLSFDFYVCICLSKESPCLTINR